MSQVVIVAFGCEIRDFHYNTKAVKLLNDRAKPIRRLLKRHGSKTSVLK